MQYTHNNVIELLLPKVLTALDLSCIDISWDILLQSKETHLILSACDEGHNPKQTLAYHQTWSAIALTSLAVCFRSRPHGQRTIQSQSASTSLSFSMAKEGLAPPPGLQCAKSLGKAEERHAKCLSWHYWDPQLYPDLPKTLLYTYVRSGPAIPGPEAALCRSSLHAVRKRGLAWCIYGARRLLSNTWTLSEQSICITSFKINVQHDSFAYTHWSSPWGSREVPGGIEGVLCPCQPDYLWGPVSARKNRLNPF